VEAGGLLAELADHRTLLIEGHIFQQDLPLLQEAARAGVPIEADFAEPVGHVWKEQLPPLAIRHVANTVDPETRTAHFVVPLANQWRAEERGGHSHLAWRFRPGQRVRLRVPVEKLENVFVLPRAAVIREGAEAFVFRQNGDLFERKPVHVLDESRTHVALASDGSLKPGSYLAQNGAGALQRIAKAQSAQGVPAGFHVHADGTVHGNH
jgi:multidrug efflux pump subunit AcrA (membrane-fusion protein)